MLAAALARSARGGLLLEAPRAARGFAEGWAGGRRDFARLEARDLDVFRGMLGPGGVLTAADDVEPYNRDWMGKYRGAGQAVLRPASTRQVSEALRYCHERRLAVVPQGGNTGLVGGSVPVFDEVVLSLGRMDRVLSFDDVSGIVACEAGCILESLQRRVEAEGHTVPVDLGARGSCQVGGNVSTNAGGLRLLRYGSLHGSVLGLEAVLADGTVLDCMQGLRKDNTGYDLKQLFIGAEGTLGVVTAVSLLCPPLPAAQHVAFLALPSFQHVLDTFALAKRHLGEILSAFEFLDRQSLDLALQQLEDVRTPLPAAAGPFYVVLETSGSRADHDREKVEAFLEELMGAGALEDGALAQDESQARAFWRLREGVNEALGRAGYVYKYDLSMPVSCMYGLVEEMRGRLAGEEALVVGYGHVGDGNLHLNISSPAYSEELLGAIEPFVYEWTSERGGSVSAEHGLGAMKAACIGYTKGPVAVDLMRRMKQTLDPHGILNPYKVLPPG